MLPVTSAKLYRHVLVPLPPDVANSFHRRAGDSVELPETAFCLGYVRDAVIGTDYTVKATMDPTVRGCVSLLLDSQARRATVLVLSVVNYQLRRPLADAVIRLVRGAGFTMLTATGAEWSGLGEADSNNNYHWSSSELPLVVTTEPD